MSDINSIFIREPLIKTTSSVCIINNTTILPCKAKGVYLSERLKIFILRKTKICISVCFKALFTLHCVKSYEIVQV